MYSNQGMNPILPLTEYIPDGEPHIFGDRIYLFGSHDTCGGQRYCAEGNYMGWSAPLSDPTNWTCSGVIFDAKQDPDYREDATNDLYAPDVVQGNDGKFYLYYNFVSSSSGTDMNTVTKVAVCDTPDGKYEYYGVVRRPDGSPENTYLMGDPAVINDDGVIRLYAGWSLSMVAAGAHAQGAGKQGEKADTYASAGQAREAAARQMPEPGTPAMRKMLVPVCKMLFGKDEDYISQLEYPLMGANTMELEDDMLTVRGPVKRVVPGHFDTPKDSDFYGHAFYEGSSIRKINGLYYFIYSSENSNELCYATSPYPDRDFHYRGTIISNGDVGYQGRKNEDRLNMTANNHGSLECINGQWYIFHHRQTQRCTFSRQACAEPVTIAADGSIAQVECTSMGLRGADKGAAGIAAGAALLPANGTIPAAVSCILTNGHMPHITNTRLEERIPCITDDGTEVYITDMTDGTIAGYKYFSFEGDTSIELVFRTTDSDTPVSDNQTGIIEVSCEDHVLCAISLKPENGAAGHAWKSAGAAFSHQGVSGLYLTYRGEGSIDLLELRLCGNQK